MSRSRFSRLRAFLPLFVTFFVVAGVVAVVLSRPAVEPEKSVGEPVTDEMVSGPAWVFEKEGEISIVQGDYKKICPLPKEDGHVVDATKDGIVIAFSSGQHSVMGFDCMMSDAQLAEGHLNPGNTHGAQIGESKSDGTGVVIFHDGRNQESVILRNAKGRPYQNPQIVGWMSDTQLVVMAFQGGERHAVAVEPSGRITQMVTLPENAVTMLAGDGAFWYVTAMPSDDIAFDVLGPSELHRVGVDGKDEMIARSEDVVIDHVTIGAEQRFAYLISGSLYVSDAGVPVDRGTGRPVGWLENGDLLVVARNSKLLAVPQGKDTRVDVMNDFPSGIGHVWSVTLESATSAR